MGWFDEISQTLTALVLPERCGSCDGPLKKEDAGRPCGNCRRRIGAMPSPWCSTCMVPLAQSSYMSHDGRCRRCTRGRAFDQARAYGPFDGLLKELISRLKYSGDKAVS